MGKWAFGVVCSLVAFLISCTVEFFLRRRVKSFSTYQLRITLDTIKQRTGGIIVHKGGIPENTLEGIKLSKRKGAAAIEVDLQFTKDGCPVLLHDETVDRTSNGTGPISCLSLNEVRSLDFGNNEHLDCTIPTLAELLATVKKLNMILILEVKLSKKEHLKTITDMFKNDSSLYQRVIVTSFYPHMLHQIMLLDPSIMVGLLVYGPMFSAEEYHSSDQLWEKKRLTVFEHAFMWVMVWVVPKLLGTTLLILNKDDVFVNRINFNELKEHGRDVIIYEITSKEELETFEGKYHTPVIINESFYLNSID